MRIAVRLKHWFFQKVLGWTPTCRCCDLVMEPIYDENVCEICQDFNCYSKRRTWR